MVDTDLDRYFERVATGRYSGCFDLELNLLDRAAAQRWTGNLAGLDWMRRFDALVLDDAETSNHHLLLRRPPFEGGVLYLNHDGDTRLVFGSLDALLQAADVALAGERRLVELHPEVSPPAPDQLGLSCLIRVLMEGSADDADLAVSLIPSMDLADTRLLADLAVRRNFFLGEAVAVEIAKRPSAALRPLAELCARHPHLQVTNAAARALKALAGEA